MNDTAGWLLVSDIDDTFLGDASATTALIQAAQKHRLTIALNSSRPWASVSQTLETLAPWRPAATITAMGTQVRIDNREDPDWPLRFAGWSRSAYDDLAQRLGWTPHDPIMQTPHKASFALPPDADRDQVTRELEAIGPAMVVISGDSDLDILPPDAGKGAATLHLAHRLNIPLDHVIVAGDSANDLAMFSVALKGVVVGNARDELRSRVDPTRVHLAIKHRAAGILEGLLAYGALPPQP